MHFKREKSIFNKLKKKKTSNYLFLKKTKPKKKQEKQNHHKIHKKQKIRIYNTQEKDQ